MLPPLFAAFLCTVALGLITTTTLISRLRGYHPPSGVHTARHEAGGTLTPSEVVHVWTQLYGEDTLRAARLTTARFRNGEDPQKWGARIHAALEDIDFHHLGGKLIEEQVQGAVATITLHARIVAVDGISTQKEIYTLQSVNGQWLIDSLRVEDEVVPGGKLRHAF
jgi:hypothetical protein